MRTAYHEQLSELSERLGDMCGLAGIAMERATQALTSTPKIINQTIDAAGWSELGEMSVD